MGTFDPSNVGTNLAISGFSLAGTSAANYTLTQPATMATRTAKGLTISGTIADNNGL